MEPTDPSPVTAPDLSSNDAAYRLLELHADVVFTLDASGRFTHIAGHWEALSGRSAASCLGERLHEFVVEVTDTDPSQWIGPTGGTEPHVVHFLRPDDTSRRVEMVARSMIDDAGRCAGAMGTLTDITVREHDELAERHGQKMEAVGRLAAGIAHEINTPIQFIGDNLQFLSESFQRVEEVLDRYRRALDGSDGGMSWADRQAMLRSVEAEADLEFVVSEVPDAAQSALEGVKRVATIVRAMRAFDHPDWAEPQRVDLNEVIRNTLIVSRNETKYVADVVEELDDLPTISGAPGDLGQVILNLVVNAADAIRDSVETGDRRSITVRSSALADGRVQVTVADTGPGMPPEVAQHIFEPFFTTKEVGRGTGQGLSLVRAIVERHHGQIWFETEVGSGTTFHVVLPPEPVEVP